MRIPVAGLILVAGVLGACRAEEKIDKPQLVDVMPIIPLPPGYEPVSASGSDEAIQLTFRSPLGLDDMSQYYRRTFTKEPWSLISDSRGADGAVILYAEYDERPLWVRVFDTPGAPGTTVQLSGALVGRKAQQLDTVTIAPDSE